MGDGTIIDEFLPLFDVSDEVATVVEADPRTTWEALMDTDLIDVGRRRPLIGLLGAVRMLPDVVWQRLHGETPPAAPPSKLTLRDVSRLPIRGGGWILLGERPPEAIALGLVGKFWRPVIEFAEVGPEEFRDWAVPGFAKTIYALGTRPLAADRTLLWAVMRTATTDPHARDWFRRYWTLGVGSGAHILAGGVIDIAREAAEARIHEPALV